MKLTYHRSYRGKTVQTITTILDNRPKLQHTRPGTKHPPSAPDLEARQKEDKLWANSVQEWEHEMAMNNIPKKMWPKKLAAARAGTLVVCPVIVSLAAELVACLKFTDCVYRPYHSGSRRSRSSRTGRVCPWASITVQIELRKCLAT